MTETSHRRISRLPFGLLERLDTLGHKLCLPKWILRPVCDEYERRLHEAFDWGYHYVATNALNDAYTSSSAGNVDVTWTRKRHDA